MDKFLHIFRIKAVQISKPQFFDPGGKGEGNVWTRAIKEIGGGGGRGGRERGEREMKNAAILGGGMTINSLIS